MDTYMYPTLTVENYQIRVLKEHVESVLSNCLSVGVLEIDPKPRILKNTTIMKISIYNDAYIYLYLKLKALNIPFIIKGIKDTGTKIYHTINQDYEFTSKRKPTPNWFEQEERYKVYKLLKITG